MRDGFDRSTYDDLDDAGVFSLRDGRLRLGRRGVVFEELGRALRSRPAGRGRFGRDAITGGLDLTVGGTQYVEHLDALDALLVLDDVGDLDGRPDVAVAGEPRTGRSTR